MLNYMLSTMNALGKVTTDFLSSPIPSADPCLVPGQNNTSLDCPVNNVTLIALQEEKCTIYYPSTADIARCMEDCYNCCSNFTQMAKDLTKSFESIYRTCGDLPSETRKDALAWSLFSFGVAGSLVSVHYFYKTCKRYGINGRNVAGWLVSSVASGSLLTSSVAIFFGPMPALITGAASFGVVTLMGVSIANRYITQSSQSGVSSLLLQHV